MKKTATALVVVVILFLTGCGLYIEGAPSFTGPILNRDLTEKPATTLSWLAGRKVVVTRGDVYYCNSTVVGHAVETGLGIRGARIVKRQDAADYEAVFSTGQEYSGHQGRITTVEVLLSVIDRTGEVQADSKGESDYWEFESRAGENTLCEAAARRAVKNLR